MKNFKLWAEMADSQAVIKTAIIGALPDELKGTLKDEEQLLNLRTTELGREIIEKIRNLGIVSSIKDQNPQKWQDISDSITNGITIKDLIDKVSDREGLGNLTSSQPTPNANISDPRVLPQQSQGF